MILGVQLVVLFFYGAAHVWRITRFGFLRVISCESEIAALYFSVSMALWLRKLVQFFGYSDGPTVIAEDNQGASTYCESMDRAGRMKHIDVKYFWIREHQRI